MATKLTAAQRTQRTAKLTATTTFYVTGAATIAANMYASDHTVVGQVTGFWTPVALFLALDMVERVHVKGRWGILRKVAVGVIALIAAWVSYWHLVHIFTLGGADVVSAHAMPITVDLLMTLARVSMNHRPSLPARRTKTQSEKTPRRSLRAV